MRFLPFPNKCIVVVFLGPPFLVLYCVVSFFRSCMNAISMCSMHTTAVFAFITDLLLLFYAEKVQLAFYLHIHDRLLSSNQNGTNVRKEKSYIELGREAKYSPCSWMQFYLQWTKYFSARKQFWCHSICGIFARVCVLRPTHMWLGFFLQFCNNNWVTFIVYSPKL